MLFRKACHLTITTLFALSGIVVARPGFAAFPDFPAFPGIPSRESVLDLLPAVQNGDSGETLTDSLIDTIDLDPEIPAPIQPLPQPVTGKGIVSLSFDDGLFSTYAVAAQIMKKHGFAGTSYVYPFVQDEKKRVMGAGYEGFMSWEQVESLQNEYGWEIGNHTYTHAHLPALPEAEMRREINKAQNRFARHDITPVGFASPYGEYNDTVLDFVSKKFEYHRNAFGGTFNEVATMNDYNLNGFDVSSTVTPTQVKQLIDEAVAGNKWLILYWHNLIPETPTLPTQYTIADFTEIIEYLDAQNVPVAPVKDGLHKQWGRGDNMIPNGHFEEGLGQDADGWVRNDTRAVKVIWGAQGVFPLNQHYARIVGGEQQYQISSAARIPVQSADHYRIKAFWKIRDWTAGSGNLWVSEFGADGSFVGGQWLGGASQGFVGTKYFDYLPSAGTERIEIFFYSAAGSSHKWFIDGVEMKMKS